MGRPLRPPPPLKCALRRLTEAMQNDGVASRGRPCAVEGAEWASQAVWLAEEPIA